MHTESPPHEGHTAAIVNSLSWGSFAQQNNLHVHNIDPEVIEAYVVARERQAAIAMAATAAVADAHIAATADQARAEVTSVTAQAQTAVVAAEVRAHTIETEANAFAHRLQTEARTVAQKA